MDMFDELGLSEETIEFKPFSLEDFQLPGGCPENLMDERLRIESLVTEGEATTCRCCSQDIAVYKRTINKSMSVWLIKLVHYYEQTKKWFEINKDTTRGGDYAKFMYWGMIIRKENTDPKKRTSGLWKPTKRGIDYAHNRIALPTRAFVYAKQLQGFSIETSYIIDTFKNEQDYRDLIAKPSDSK